MKRLAIGMALAVLTSVSCFAYWNSNLVYCNFEEGWYFCEFWGGLNSDDYVIWHDAGHVLLDPDYNNAMFMSPQRGVGVTVTCQPGGNGYTQVMASVYNDNHYNKSNHMSRELKCLSWGGSVIRE